MQWFTFHRTYVSYTKPYPLLWNAVQYIALLPSLMMFYVQHHSPHLIHWHAPPRDVIWGGQGGHSPPWIWKIVSFCDFAYKILFFFIFCPPLEIRSKFCPPLEKTEMTSLAPPSASNCLINRSALCASPPFLDCAWTRGPHAPFRGRNGR